MKNQIKTEDEIYGEIKTYINGKNHKRPITLSTIKKELRTQKIVDLVFSRPDIFDLRKEILYIPEEKLSEKSLLMYVLTDPKNFASLDERYQTLPVMIAFEIAKRRHERASALSFGCWGERLSYSGQMIMYRNGISDICDKLNIKFEDSFFDNFENIISTIQKFCSEFKIELTKEKQYIPKYFNVNFNCNKKILILISGVPDSGKTKFQKKLGFRIPNSFCFDSDFLLEMNALYLPLERIIPQTSNVIIFSDIYAYKFFSKKELENFIITNIIIKPSSIEKMYRHSKHLQYIDFENYKKYEIDNINLADAENPIIVTNNYDESIDQEVDNVIEQIFKRLDLALPDMVDDEPITPGCSFFKSYE